MHKPSAPAPAGSPDRRRPPRPPTGHPAVPSVRRAVESLEPRTLFAIATNDATWTPVGPTVVTNSLVSGNGPISGRVTGIAIDPTNANVSYVASADGGVWKTVDGGTTWADVTTTQPSLVSGAIAIAPSNPAVVYVGTGEADDTSDSYYGTGVLKTTDGGVTWQSLGAQFAGQSIAHIAVAPADPNTLYMAVDNDAVNGTTSTATPTAAELAANPDAGTAGIYKSTDGGVTWRNTTNSAVSGAIGTSAEDRFYDVEINPQDPLQVFATFDSTTNGQSGIYETFNGGVTWGIGGQILDTQGNAFGTLTQFGRVAVAIAPSDPTVVYASIESADDGALGGTGDPNNTDPGFLVKSVDGGQTFNLLLNAPSFSFGQGFYDNEIVVSPTDPNTFYVGGSSTTGTTAASPPGGEVFQSTDGGTTYTDVTTGHAGNNGVGFNVHALTFDASGRLVVGTDDGVWRLDNAGATSVAWTDLNTNLADDQFVNVAVDPTNANRLIGGTNSAGSVTYSGSTSWAQTLREPVGGYTVIDQTNPSVVYTTTADKNTFLYKSTNGGTSFAESDTGITSQTSAAFYPPLVQDPDNHNRLLVGTDEVYESTDAAGNWTSIGQPGTNNFNPNDAPVTAIGVGNHGPGGVRVYASAGGLTFVTTDDGADWTEVDLPTVAAAADLTQQTGVTVNPPTVRKFIVDPVNSEIVTVVVGGFSLVDTTTDANTKLPSTLTTGHVYRTVDGGTTWTDISGGGVTGPDGVAVGGTAGGQPLPDVPFHALAATATGINGFASVLYAGGDAGVYVSYDGGLQWTPMGTGLPPNTIINDLEVDPANNTLVAATYGRGVYEIGLTVTRGGTVGDRVFDDTNDDGVDTGTEPGVGGAIVQLFNAGADGTAGTADDALLATTTTDANGFYRFTGLASGTDYVHVIAPGGFYFSDRPTAAAQASVTAAVTRTPSTVAEVSTTDPTTGDSPTFAVTGGTTSPSTNDGVDAGLYQKTLTVSAPTVDRPAAGGTATLNYVVTITPANDQPVTLTYATTGGTAVAGTDYTSTTGTLTIPAGQTSATIAVPVLPGTGLHGDRTVDLTVTAPAGFVFSPSATVAGTIVNVIFPVATVSNLTVTRDPLGAQNVTFTVTLSAAAPFAGTVQYSTVDASAAAGVDYTAVSGTLTFAAGQTTQTVQVSVAPGMNPVVNRSFLLQLSNPVDISFPNGAATTSGTALIVSNVLPVITASDASVTESLTGQTLLTFTLSLNATVGNAVTVDYATADGTAVAGSDYTATAGTLTFAPGQVTQTVTVPVARVFLPGQSKTLTLNLSNVLGGPGLASAVATGTINDLNLASLPFDGTRRATYTDGLNHRVTVSLRGPGSGQVVFLGTGAAHTNAYEILLDGSTAASALTVSIAGGGGGQTTLNNIVVSGALGTVSARGVNVQQGTVSLAGGATVVNLGYLAGSTLTIGGSAGSVAITLRRAVNSPVTSAIPIRSLTAQAFVNTGTTPVYVTAPNAVPIHVRGKFGGVLQQTGAVTPL